MTIIGFLFSLCYSGMMLFGWSSYCGPEVSRFIANSRSVERIRWVDRGLLIVRVDRVC